MSEWPWYKCLYKCEWKNSRAFVVRCSRTAARWPKLGLEQSVRVDVVFLQIFRKMLMFSSAWQRVDEVFDKAGSYFFWIKKNEAKDVVYDK